MSSATVLVEYREVWRMRTIRSDMQGDAGGDQENSFAVGGLCSCDEPGFKA